MRQHPSKNTKCTSSHYIMTTYYKNRNVRKSQADRILLKKVKDD